MSAALPVTARAGRPAPAARPAPTRRAPARPPLRVVPDPRRVAGRAPFLAVLAGLLVTGLLLLLALNTVLAQDAFALHELQVEGKRLADREQALATEVQDLEAPAALTARAAELGLVQSGPPGFLRLPEGVVLGDPAPAVAPTPQEAP